jgi:hypothetical protein
MPKGWLWLLEKREDSKATGGQPCDQNEGADRTKSPVHIVRLDDRKSLPIDPEACRDAVTPGCASGRIRTVGR